MPKGKRQHRDTPLLKISIDGPDVKPGRIAIPVLLKLCQEAQAAINRQAEVIESKASDKVPTSIIQRECTLELVGLKKGSTTLEFSPANKQMSLMPEMSAMSIDAVTAVAQVLQDVNKKRGAWIPPDPKLLDALDDLGAVFESGIDRVLWIVPRHGKYKTARAEFIPATLQKVRRRKQESLALSRANGGVGELAPMISEQTSEIVSQAPQAIQASILEGMLEVAEGKIRITPSIGSPTTISYGPDKAEIVLESIHKPVRVKVDAKVRKVVDIEVTASDMLDQRLFFNAKSIDELVAEQRVHAISDLSSLAGEIPDEDIDAFIDDIYKDRVAQE